MRINSMGERTRRSIVAAFQGNEYASVDTICKRTKFTRSRAYYQLRALMFNGLVESEPRNSEHTSELYRLTVKGRSLKQEWEER